MQEIKIGTLHPASGIYPKMGIDFENGIKLALKLNEKINKEYSFSFYKEYVKNGDHKTTKEMILKLNDYEDVDLIAGIINSRVLQLLVDELQHKNIPIIANNLGEYIPKKENETEFITGNSLNLWQSQWSMGYWAQKKYGGNPLICTSLYDGGYLLHNSFRLGAIAAGAEDVSTSLIHLQPGIVDTSELIEKINTTSPSHVHAVLCGIDAKDFLQRFHNAGLHGKVPLTVSPFMVEDNLMDELSDIITDIPNAINWSLNLNSPVNSTFTTHYTEYFRKYPNVFSLLGYETGLAINKTLLQFLGMRFSPLEFSKALKEVSFESPRGKMQLGFQNQNFKALIRNAKQSDKQYSNTIIHEQDSVSITDDQIIQSAINNVSGWLNPYLCM